MPSYYRDPAAPRPNGPRRIGVTALLERGDTILVERRSDEASDAWAFIGGRLGHDETILDALDREVREETGFTLESAALFGLFSEPTRIIEYPDGNVVGFVSVVFRAVPAGNAAPTPSDESREMRFLPRESLRSVDMWPVHLPIRDAYLGNPDAIVVA